jgi:uncharacterized membrane protein HdeD (DUF308 family)
MEMGLEKWWSYLLRGILAILFGIIALVWPGATVFVLIILFGCYALVEGLFATGYSIAKASRGEKWFALLMLGIVGILIGIVTLARPGVTSVALLVVIAIWFLLRGFFGLISAIEMSGSTGIRVFLGIVAALGILVGILLLAAPISGVFAIILVIGIYSIAIGILLSILSFTVKGAEESSGPDMTAAA